MKDARSQLVDWRVKNDFLKSQVETLGKYKNFPIISIAVFLLKTQLIEFELKQLITSLDLHILLSNPSSDLKIKPRTPRDLDDDRVTLGGLNKIVQRYESKFIKKLQTDLNSLVGLRNDFVHKLFNFGTIKIMLKDSETGLKLADIVIADIEDVENYLNKNDPLKKSS